MNGLAAERERRSDDYLIDPRICHTKHDPGGGAANRPAQDRGGRGWCPEGEVCGTLAVS